MRSTPVIALAALLASLPARAVELIELHDPVQRVTHLPAPSPAYLHAYLHAHLQDHVRDHRIVGSPLNASVDYPIDYLLGYIPGYPPGTLPGEEGGAIAAASTPGRPPPADALDATPVPEPVSVLMLACGLLLMMPGAWAARWSRLGDSESLLQRRLPWAE